MGSHFGVGAPPILVFFVFLWGFGCSLGLGDFDPWPYVKIGFGLPMGSCPVASLYIRKGDPAINLPSLKRQMAAERELCFPTLSKYDLRRSRRTTHSAQQTACCPCWALHIPFTSLLSKKYVDWGPRGDGGEKSVFLCFFQDPWAAELLCVSQEAASPEVWRM